MNQTMMMILIVYAASIIAAAAIFAMVHLVVVLLQWWKRRKKVFTTIELETHLTRAVKTGDTTIMTSAGNFKIHKKGDTWLRIGEGKNAETIRVRRIK